MGDFKSTLIREQPWKGPSWIGLKKHWVTAVEKIIVSVIYCSPRQSNDKFDWFISNFEQLLGETNKSKPPLFVISDDFNAKCFLWWSNDINSTERSKLFSVTSFNGFCQFINELTHVQTSSSLIISDQPNLSRNSGVYASLQSIYHHQPVHSSFNHNISYDRLIWATNWELQNNWFNYQ